MEERSSPDFPPQPIDEAYPVAPPVRDWSELPPVPRTSDAGEAYDVGEEVAEAPYRVDAQSSREIVAAESAAANSAEPNAPSASDDIYEMGPQEAPLRFRWTNFEVKRARRSEARRNAELQKIGKWNDPRRITLRGLFFVFTLSSFVFAVGARMPRGAFAGAAGLAALLTAAASRWLIGGSAPAKIAWWTLMAVYLSASIFALLNL